MNHLNAITAQLDPDDGAAGSERSEVLSAHLHGRLSGLRRIVNDLLNAALHDLHRGGVAAQRLRDPVKGDLCPAPQGRRRMGGDPLHHSGKLLPNAVAVRAAVAYGLRRFRVPALIWQTDTTTGSIGANSLDTMVCSC